MMNNDELVIDKLDRYVCSIHAIYLKIIVGIWNKHVNRDNHYTLPLSDKRKIIFYERNDLSFVASILMRILSPY